jgi:hypothetical protein
MIKECIWLVSSVHKTRSSVSNLLVLFYLLSIDPLYLKQQCLRSFLAYLPKMKAGLFYSKLHALVYMIK